MIKWAVKKFLLRQMNKVLDQYKDNTTKVQNALDTWIGRLQRILACLKNILAKLDDGRIDDVEMDESVVEIENVVKQW